MLLPLLTKIIWHSKILLSGILVLLSAHLGIPNSTSIPIPTNISIISPTTSPETTIPIATPFSNIVPTYRNYGWYMHNGQSMQYIDGNWFSIPQQNIPTASPINWNQWSKDLQNQINNSAQNTSGACSDHGGVNCAAGPQPNGNAICKDGWTGSSIPYVLIAECSIQQCSASAETAMNQLNQSLGSIGIPGMTMDVVAGRTSQTYQNWIRDNQDTYSYILGNSTCYNRLRAILGSYGL